MCVHIGERKLTIYPVSAMGNFEVFQKGTRPGGNEPTVTLRGRGAIVLNRAAYAALGEPDAVELLFDTEDRRMALRACDKEALNAYPLNQSRNQQSYSISGNQFARFHKIAIEAPRHLKAVREGDLLCVDVGPPEGIHCRGLSLVLALLLSLG